MTKAKTHKINSAINFWGNIPGWVLLSDYQPVGLVGMSAPYAVLLEGIRTGKIKSLSCNKSQRQAVFKSEADAYVAANQKPNKPDIPEGLGNVFSEMPGWVQLSSYDTRENKLIFPKSKEYKVLSNAILTGELLCVRHSRSKKIGVNKEAADALLQERMYRKYEIAKQPEVIANEVITNPSFGDRYFVVLSELSKTRRMCYKMLEELKNSVYLLEKVLKEGEENAKDKIAEANVLCK
jgi:hypothetical protein